MSSKPPCPRWSPGSTLQKKPKQNLYVGRIPLNVSHPGRRQITTHKEFNISDSKLVSWQAEILRVNFKGKAVGTHWEVWPSACEQEREAPTTALPVSPTILYQLYPACDLWLISQFHWGLLLPSYIWESEVQGTEGGRRYSQDLRATLSSLLL